MSEGIFILACVVAIYAMIAAGIELASPIPDDEEDTPND